MSHAIEDMEVSAPQQQGQQKTKNKSLSRELLQITAQLLNFQDLYNQSQLPGSVNRQLQAIGKIGAPVTRMISLGLGSLLVTKGHARRLKQLVILLSIRKYLQDGRKEPIEIYAQDPTFTRSDETLLAAFGVQILRTASGSDLGEAASFITPSTIVYSPFLTLEAYEQLILKTSVPMHYLIGDDFDALLQKWPKRSAERRQVEVLVKTGLSKYRRKAVAGAGFWTEEDETFPMAVYSRSGAGLEKLRARM
ncbi:hypothetical protein B5807_11433 [Epicoccum nigrum]|jgi:hypothetical protein|uniref:SRR1-like domain-containing protein n=1 Tax=Epicoccum nigrum TaxID=105696 RepID=A0A1Y2LM62_EPING|nr:hypothetical protein B5807_11433 [Epicoccum nigrum]